MSCFSNLTILISVLQVFFESTLPPCCLPNKGAILFEQVFLSCESHILSGKNILKSLNTYLLFEKKNEKEKEAALLSWFISQVLSMDESHHRGAHTAKKGECHSALNQMTETLQQLRHTLILTITV